MTPREKKGEGVECIVHGVLRLRRRVGVPREGGGGSRGIRRESGKNIEPLPAHGDLDVLELEVTVGKETPVRLDAVVLLLPALT